MNLYAYTGNDPINFIDPSGLTPADGDEVVVQGVNHGAPSNLAPTSISAGSPGGGGTSPGGATDDEIVVVGYKSSLPGLSSAFLPGTYGSDDQCGNVSGNTEAQFRAGPRPPRGPVFGPPRPQTLPKNHPPVPPSHPAVPNLQRLGITRPQSQWDTKGPGPGFSRGGPQEAWYNPTTRTSVRRDNSPHDGYSHHYDIKIGRGRAPEWRYYPDGRFQPKQDVKYIPPQIANSISGQCYV